MLMWMAFTAGIGCVFLVVLGGYFLDKIKARIKNSHGSHITVEKFLRKFGWQTVQRERGAKLSQTNPVANVYEAYDWYWKKQFEREFPKPENVLMARFDAKGQCDVVDGTSWDVAVYQLNELLKLETPEEGRTHYATKPPAPVIIKRRRQSAPGSLG